LTYRAPSTDQSTLPDVMVQDPIAVPVFDPSSLFFGPPSQNPGAVHLLKFGGPVVKLPSGTMLGVGLAHDAVGVRLTAAVAVALVSRVGDPRICPNGNGTVREVPTVA
jgi:hypothetical protein